MIIKLFGLYALIQMVMYYIPVNFNMFLYGFDVNTAAILVATSLVLFGIFIGIVKKVDNIIDFLNLDNGFDEDRIDFGSFSESKIISTVLIIIGGFLIVDYFPSFLHNLFSAFRKTANTTGIDDMLSYNMMSVDYFGWFISVINIILGYLLVTKHKFVTNWLMAKSINEK